MARTRHTRILILGGGFGGVYTAMTLEKRFRRDANVDITLVSKENYLVFQPMLPEVISGSVGLLDVLTPLRRLCPRTTLYTRTIESIDLDTKRVTAPAGFGSRQSSLEYDHLVLALGNVTSFVGQPGLAEHALPFKDLGDALRLRNHVIHVLEDADIERDPAVRQALLTFVVAGGGFSGVEVVAALNDFVRQGVKNFRHIQPADLRVILLHSGGRLLPELPESLAQFAQGILGKRGVAVRLNTRLHGATAEAALLVGGERLPTRTLVSTVPTAPNPLVSVLPVPKERGRIVVNEHLEVPGYPGVWAVGDGAWVLDAKTGEPCPPTAQHAIRQARCAGENIHATVRGTARRAFSFTALGKLGSLGHHAAVAEIHGVKLTGCVAWWLWRAIYLLKLPGLDRKVRVVTGWLLDLIWPPDMVQLKTDRACTMRREHYEPHEVICREGDRGDWLYIIMGGELEVVKHVSDQGELLYRRLGAGECFGEIALVTHSPRTATVRSCTAVDVIALDRDAFGALFATFPPLRAFFEQLTASRLATPPYAWGTPARLDTADLTTLLRSLTDSGHELAQGAYSPVDPPVALTQTGSYPAWEDTNQIWANIGAQGRGESAEATLSPHSQRFMEEIWVEEAVYQLS
jgi:NADH dehydrogenase